MKKQSNRNYLSIKEAAAKLKVSPQWVRALVNQGVFSGVLRGVQRSYWIPEEQVETQMKKLPGQDRLIKREI